MPEPPQLQPAQDSLPAKSLVEHLRALAESVSRLSRILCSSWHGTVIGIREILQWLLRDTLSAWVVVGAVVLFLWAGGISLVSTDSMVADVFFVTGSLLLIAKILTWEELYQKDKWMRWGVMCSAVLFVGSLTVIAVNWVHRKKVSMAAVRFPTAAEIADELAKRKVQTSPVPATTNGVVPAPLDNNSLSGFRHQSQPEVQAPAILYRPYSPTRTKPIFGQMTHNRAEILIRQSEWFRKPDTIDVMEVYEFTANKSDQKDATSLLNIFYGRDQMVESGLWIVYSFGLIDFKFILKKIDKYPFFLPDIYDYEAQVVLTDKATGANEPIPYSGPNLGFTPPKWSFIRAVKAFGQVTGIAPASSLYGPNSLVVKYTWEWQTTELGIAAKRNYGGIEDSEAILKLYDDGWRVER